MMNETLRMIHKRRSHRAYEQIPVTQQQLDALLQAALASPSAMNRQPWHFSVVRDQALLDDMNAAVWEQMMKRKPEMRSHRFADRNFHVFYHAPVVIVLSGMPDNHYTPIDCGIAVENIALAAESMGLGSVILGMPRDAFAGAQADHFRRALQFPEGWDFVIAIAVGVPADTKEAHPVQENKISFIGAPPDKIASLQAEIDRMKWNMLTGGRDEDEEEDDEDEEEIGSEMLNAHLELIAKLVEAKIANPEAARQAAQIIRDSKIGE